MYKNEISVSKTKTIFLIFICILFITMSIAFIQFSNEHLYKKMFMGVIVIPFSLVGIYALVRILNDKSKKIIISYLGIEDCFTNPSVGLISWFDVYDVQIIKMHATKMLAIYVRNPDEYLEKTPLKKRRGLKNNLRLVGTPFVVPLYQFNTNSKKILASIDLALEDWRAVTQVTSDKDNSKN